MYRNPQRVALLLVTAWVAAGFGDAQRCTLVSMKADEVRIQAEIAPKSCRDRTAPLIAFSTLPGERFDGTVAFPDGSTRPLLPTAAGWAGDYYLQWCSFTADHLPCADTLRRALVNIRFDTPLYASVSPRSVSLRDGVLRVPLGRPAAKKLATTAMPFTSGLKIEIDRDGIYELSGAMLKERGVPVGRITARTYRLFEGVRETPLHIPAEFRKILTDDDRILFYGRRLRDQSGRPTQYSSTNSYWLTWGDRTGMRAAVVSGARRIDPTVYSANRGIKAIQFFDTLRIEEDNTVMWLGNIADRPPEELTGLPGAAETDIDNWYWGIVGATALTSYECTIPSPASRGSARLVMGLMGLSGIDSVAEDHRVDIFINDNPVGRVSTARWDGQRPFVFVSDTFSSGNLRHGINKLTLHTPSPFADRSALNWVRIEYLRGYEAHNDRVFFDNDPRSIGTTVEYTLTGFSSGEVDVWDITRNRIFTGTIIERGTGALRGSSSVIFQDSIASAAGYLAQNIAQRLVPLALTLDTLRSFWDTVSQVDYIAIGPDSFRTEVEPLLQTHKTRGLTTMYVAIDDIYNRFCGGVRDPEGIRLFLRHLFGRLAGRLPRYLLLCGDTTHDLDKNNRRRNLVPTHLSRIPGWGPAADDGYFATINDGDLFPDLSVGRLPARDHVEMRRLAQKTIRFIREPNRGYWRDNLLLLGGGEPVFTTFNDEAASEDIGGRMHLLRMDADPQSRFYKDGFTAPRLIADHVNTGIYAINFNGHGGGNVWSDNDFFGYNDLALLHNGQWGGGGRLPVIFSFTCLTGFFESSEYRSLGEEFLRSGDDGAIGFYGASAYTSRSGNLIMNKLMLDAAFSGASATLGDLINSCEMSMLVQYKSQYLFLVRQYNLLGDPALPWTPTPDTLTFESVLAGNGGPLTVSGGDTPVKNGSVRVSLNADYTTWDQTITAVRDGKFSATFPLKEGMKSTLATIRVYAWNDSAEVRGWMPFVKDTLLVTDVRTDPANPFFDDSVFVSCLPGGLSDSAAPQLYCLYGIAEKNNANAVFKGAAMTRGENGRWTTAEKIHLPFTAPGNNRLLLYFRVITAEKSLQSPVFPLVIGGRPDLVGTMSRLSIYWNDDSLRIPVEVLNTGNAAAPPFTLSFIWNVANAPHDTFATVRMTDTLWPGARRTFECALPDTQGDLDYYVVINPARTFAEIMHENNRVSGRSGIYFRDMLTTADTLTISSGRLRVSPARSFEKTVRVFLLEDTIAAPQPLLSPSQWAIRRDSIALKWYLESRPALGGGDSLLWSAQPQAGKTIADTTWRKTVVMEFDTTIRLWRCSGNPNSAGPDAATATTAGRGPFSIARLTDISPPELLASVFGKTLDRPDYTAKDRPFTVFFSDPSGVLPQSIGLFINGKPLSQQSYAQPPLTGDLRSISLSAYPQAERAVDSLLVQCSDLAGNSAVRTFAYLPGSDLMIRSFSCHPNPFTARRNGDGTISMVRFAFLLTDVASSVTLSIYTVSGKKIRTWSLNDLIGYHQVAWDGRDREGYRIANGTYYAKLIAKNDRKKVKETIRIAKLEGF